MSVFDYMVRLLLGQHQAAPVVGVLVWKCRNNQPRQVGRIPTRQH